MPTTSRPTIATSSSGTSAARTRGGPVEISIKPTQLGLDQSGEACLALCMDLAALANERGTWFWLDMEGSDYTDATIRLYERLRERHDRVGIAIQAYLRRTAADVARLLPFDRRSAS